MFWDDPLWPDPVEIHCRCYPENSSCAEPEACGRQGSMTEQALETGWYWVVLKDKNSLGLPTGGHAVIAKGGTDSSGEGYLTFNGRRSVAALPERGLPSDYHIGPKIDPPRVIPQPNGGVNWDFTDSKTSPQKQIGVGSEVYDAGGNKGLVTCRGGQLCTVKWASGRIANTYVHDLYLPGETFGSKATVTREGPCDDCNGSGEYVGLYSKSTCETCSGTGITSK